MKLSRLDFADSELFDEFSVLYDVLVSQISFESSSLSNEKKQTASTVVVLLVRSQVVRDLCDTGLHDRNLDLGGTGVAFFRRVIRDRARVQFWIQRHL
jgi:hypothetical protein